MFEKFSRSWTLIKASAGVLRADRELLLLPLMSSIAALLVVASFVLPAIGLGWVTQLDEGGEASPVMYAWMFAFYLSQYFVMFFFNSALVGAAMIRLDGGDPTVRDGLRIAWSRVGAIFGYALIAATVGLILRMIEERAGFVGRIVVGLIGAAWTVVTFIAVPVLVAREVGPLQAVQQSASLLKQSWGENLIGAGGIGLVFGLLTALVLCAGIGLGIALGVASGSGVLAAVLIGATVIAVIVLALVQSALSGIYSAALYRYAVSGDAPAGFDGAMLQGAFKAKA